MESIQSSCPFRSSFIRHTHTTRKVYICPNLLRNKQLLSMKKKSHTFDRYYFDFISPMMMTNCAECVAQIDKKYHRPITQTVALLMGRNSKPKKKKQLKNKLIFSLFYCQILFSYFSFTPHFSSIIPFCCMGTCASSNDISSV